MSRASSINAIREYGVAGSDASDLKLPRTTRAEFVRKNFSLDISLDPENVIHGKIQLLKVLYFDKL